MKLLLLLLLLLLLFNWLLKDSMKHNYDYELVINKFLRGQNFLNCL